MPSFKEIKKELHDLKCKLIIGGENRKNATNLAQKAMNLKYGYGWRNKK